MCMFLTRQPRVPWDAGGKYEVMLGMPTCHGVDACALVYLERWSVPVSSGCWQPRPEAESASSPLV